MDDPDWRPDSAFMRDLMRWFVAHAPPPQERLTNPELALFVDYLASRYFSVTRACKLVAQSEKRNVENVTRAHQRYGTPAKELKARRECWQQTRKGVELEVEHVARWAGTGLAEVLGTRSARMIKVKTDAQGQRVKPASGTAAGLGTALAVGGARRRLNKKG